MAWHLIMVTQRLVTRLGDLRCRRCGRKLEVGEDIWRHSVGKDTQHYCKGCYKKLWF